MPQRQSHSTSALADAPQPVRSWRLLLLVLLVVLPITVSLASPEPIHFPSADAVQHESGMHIHAPSDTPTCHHVGHHGETAAVVNDNREAELSAPADGAAAIPNQGPAHGRLTVAEGLPHVAPSDHPRPTLPVYLRTLRLRV